MLASIRARLVLTSRRHHATLLCLAWFSLTAAGFTQTPGAAIASTQGVNTVLSNDVIAASWSATSDGVTNLVVTDKLHNASLRLPFPFALLLKNGAILRPDKLQMVKASALRSLSPQREASRYSDHLDGKQFDTEFEDSSSGAHILWSVALRDGSNYVRQFVTIRAGDTDLPIAKVEWFDIQLPGARISGSVKGSPVIVGNMFLGFEHPLSNAAIVGDRVVLDLDRELPLKAGQSITYSAVIGVAAAGQMRRDFLYYIERERAHPYRTFLHYNSWYDLGYFSSYDVTGALDRVNAFGRELHEKRGVPLSSYLFDDGWDNHASLWSFNRGFPDGFTPVKEAAAKYGAAPGVWLSPWGGYGDPKRERVKLGKEAGYEIVDDGFALSGPKYYARFRDACLEMIRKYGVNQFKIDGTGNANSVFRGSAFDSDFSAAIHLIGELREAKPDIYINLTTGTYPSPFWLLYADSIWRGGDDDNFLGVGTYRERWITYRDADTYQHIVQAGPLFPLNSLMLHGMIYAQQHKELKNDPGDDFRNEVRSYFGTGTQLQEMYITPSLLTPANWDDLAEAANWSHANADTLKDTHWVGGDPAWLEVYGWASWTPKKGILVLRNPGDHPQSIALDIGETFELPKGAPRSYVLKSPWKSDAGTEAIALQAGEKHTFELAPFQVLTLDAAPK